jgi:hypothetical protein
LLTGSAGAAVVSRERREELDRVTTEWAFWWTLACFTLTYLGLALGKVPGLRVDRAGIALLTLALGIAWLQFASY